MSRKNDRWAPPPRGARPPTEPVEPLEPIDLYPNPVSPRPPETRETILADLHAGFASLTNDELKVAQLWIFGRSLDDVCYFLKLDKRTAKRLWRGMRRKLREALIKGNAPRVQLTQNAPSNAGMPPGAGGTSPA